MDPSSLLVLIRYHAWANEQILSTAQALSGDELRRPAPLDYGTAFRTLRHIVDVDWGWREYCIGNDVGESCVWDYGFKLDDLESLRGFCLEEDARLREYVEGLDSAALAEPVGVRSLPRWLVITHLVHHGTQHRSELARYFTECGHSPGDLNLIDAINLP